MSRWNRSVAWTAGAVGVVLGGMLGVVAGGLICVAAGECGLEGFLFAGWGLIIGIPVGGFGFASLASRLQRSGRRSQLAALGGFLGAVLGFAAALLIGFIGSWSLQPAGFGVALLVLVPLFAVSAARMAARSSRP